ncbi:hypothetical protein Hanom_Chr05g00451371 [Helianthus anomalus]
MLFTYTQAFTGNTIGALTYSFTNAVKSARNLTYGDLLGGLVNPTKEVSLARRRLFG